MKRKKLLPALLLMIALMAALLPGVAFAEVGDPPAPDTTNNPTFTITPDVSYLVYDASADGTELDPYFYYSLTDDAVNAADHDTPYELSADGKVLTLKDGFNWKSSTLPYAIMVLDPECKIEIKGTVMLGALYETDEEAAIYVMNNDKKECAFELSGVSSDAKLGFSLPDVLLPEDSVQAAGVKAESALMVKDLDIEGGTAEIPIDMMLASYHDITMDAVKMNGDVSFYAIYSEGSAHIKNNCDIDVDMTKGVFVALANSIDVNDSKIACNGGFSSLYAMMGSIGLKDSILYCNKVLGNVLQAFGDDHTIVIDNSDVTFENVGESENNPGMGIVAMAEKNTDATVEIKDSNVAISGNVSIGVVTDISSEGDPGRVSGILISDSVVSVNASISGLWDSSGVIEITGKSDVTVNGGSFGMNAGKDILIDLAPGGRVEAHATSEAEGFERFAMVANSTDTITIRNAKITLPIDGFVQEMGGRQFIASEADPENPALQVTIEAPPVPNPKTGVTNGLVIAIVLTATGLLATAVMKRKLDVKNV